MSKKPPIELSPKDQALWNEYVQKQVEGHKPVAPFTPENFEELLAAQERSAEVDIESVKEIEDISVEPVLERKKDSLKVDITHPRQLDKRTEEKLRKGKMPIERKLDLHGFNKSQAYAALENFITTAFNQKCRCVLVVTGKGKPKTSAGWLEPAEGILKQNVPQWLSTPPLNREVLKILPAQPKDGGSGAIYVYLRRNKI